MPAASTPTDCYAAIACLAPATKEKPKSLGHAASTAMSTMYASVVMASAQKGKVRRPDEESLSKADENLVPVYF